MLRRGELSTTLVLAARSHSKIARKTRRFARKAASIARKKDFSVDKATRIARRKDFFANKAAEIARKKLFSVDKAPRIVGRKIFFANKKLFFATNLPEIKRHIGAYARSDGAFVVFARHRQFQARAVFHDVARGGNESKSSGEFRLPVAYTWEPLARNEKNIQPEKEAAIMIDHNRDFNLLPGKPDAPNSSRLAGCQSTNHNVCDLENGLWECDRCKKSFCIADGAADGYYGLCDSCWHAETLGGTVESLLWKSRNGAYDHR